jgi:type II secretory pathway pseudopilin PulG
METRRAATLIELMAVMSIIGTLTTLLLPAIQGARETSRANTCRNNLRQVGIALLNFESAHHHFPMGAKARFDPKLSPTVMYDFSWWVDTIPLMEQKTVVDQLDRTGVSVGWVALNARNGEAADGFAPDIWFCPSSLVTRFAGVGKYKIAAPSYTGISGATDYDGFRESRVNKCCLSDGEISGGGVLIPNAVIRTQQITDGLSKTLIVGEQSDFGYNDTGQPYTLGGGFGKGWLAGAQGLGTPPKYLNPNAPAHNLTTIRYALNDHRYSQPGIYYDLGSNNPLVSPHHGFVHLLYCDGSVHAGADSMSIESLKRLATRDDGGEVGD